MQIAYGNVGLILATTLDPSFLVMPDAREWSSAFASLRSERHAGYYWGSPVSIPPIGAHQIFEGQARFGQLQYLYFASGGKLTWYDVRAFGMLKGVYGEAFEKFLQYAELEWPPSIDHPIVALFLLVCDIAINPEPVFRCRCDALKPSSRTSILDSASCSSAEPSPKSAPTSRKRSEIIQETNTARRRKL